MKTVVSSATKEVIIGDDRPTVLIGERINPAGKKKLAEALRAGDLEVVRREALAQTRAGADILDVGVGTFGVDEVALLPRAVQVVMDTVETPLCLDSANPQALEAALRVYKGRPLVNSFTGARHSLDTVLPLVREYGAAAIGLAQDEGGIPKSAEQRTAIARRLVAQAEVAGIAREDIIIDCLALAVGADAGSGPAVLGALRQIKAELGVNLTLGASNVSFGLPDRDRLNSAFAVMAVAAGATCLIVDVARVRPMILAADLVLAKDNRARRYLEAYRRRRPPSR